MTSVAFFDSFFWMIRERTLRARQKLVSKLPVTGEILRGSVSYAGGRTRQISVRRERVPEVRRWLDNYQKLKETIETICEINHDLLRPEKTAAKRERKSRD